MWLAKKCTTNRIRYITSLHDKTYINIQAKHFTLRHSRIIDLVIAFETHLDPRGILVAILFDILPGPQKIFFYQKTCKINAHSIEII